MSRFVRDIHTPLLIALAAVALACATIDPQESPVAKMARRDWRPTSAGLGDWVWIRLDTDEWLKGRIIVLRNDSLQFESDNLGKMTIDWDDVSEVYSRRPNEFLFGEDDQVTGGVSVVDNVVTVTGPGGQRHVHPRDELRSIVPAGRNEIDHWSGNVSVGIGYRAGNTDQIDGSVDVDIARRTLGTRYSFSYLGSYSEANDDVLANNHRLNTSFDVFLTWRFFVTPASLELYRDPIVNIRWQATPGVGAGYTIIDQPKLMWDFTAGVGYRYTEYESVQPGEERTDGLTALQFGTTFEFEITGNLDLDISDTLTLGVPHTEQWQNHFQARLSFDVTDDIDFDVTFVWDRNDTTVRDEDGVPPNEYDIHITFGLGVDF